MLFGQTVPHCVPILAITYAFHSNGLDTINSNRVTVVWHRVSIQPFAVSTVAFQDSFNASNQQTLLSMSPLSDAKKYIHLTVNFHRFLIQF